MNDTPYKVLFRTTVYHSSGGVSVATSIGNFLTKTLADEAFYLANRSEPKSYSLKTDAVKLYQ